VVILKVIQGHSNDLSLTAQRIRQMPPRNVDISIISLCTVSHSDRNKSMRIECDRAIVVGKAVETLMILSERTWVTQPAVDSVANSERGRMGWTAPGDNQERAAN